MDCRDRPAALRGRDGYGVQVRLDAGREAVRTDVVRSAGHRAGKAEDTGAEQAFCKDYADLAGRMRRQGLYLDLVGLREPGTAAVAEVPAEVLATDARRRGAGRAERREQ